MLTFRPLTHDDAADVQTEGTSGEQGEQQQEQGEDTFDEQEQGEDALDKQEQQEQGEGTSINKLRQREWRKLQR
eukprot:gene33153-7992_t